MSKNKSSKKYFPNNLRFITDNLLTRFIYKFRREIIITATSLLICIAIFAVSYDWYRNHKRNEILDLQRSKVINEATFWESVSEEYPGNRDVYYNLAVLNFRLKRVDEARNYLRKALQVDPNFEEGRRLEAELGN